MIKQASPDLNVRIKTDATNISEPSVSDPQIDADIEVLDQIIAHQDAMEKAGEKVRRGWVVRPNFWSDPPDPSLLPFTGDFNGDYGASWDELWYLVGAYLFDAMAQYEDESSL